MSELALKFYYYILSWLSRLKNKNFLRQSKEEIFKEVNVTSSDNDCKVSGSMVAKSPGVRPILSPKLRSPVAATRTSPTPTPVPRNHNNKHPGVRLILSPKLRSPLLQQEPPQLQLLCLATPTTSILILVVSVICHFFSNMIPCKSYEMLPCYCRLYIIIFMPLFRFIIKKLKMQT
jgi:hypothetical protein